MALSPQCAAIATQIDALNARIVAHSQRLNAGLDATLAAQAAQQAELDRQRQQTARRALVGGVLGQVIPGADLAASIAGRAAAPTKVAPMAPATDELNAALAGSRDLGELSVQAGSLMTQFEQAGCRPK